MEEVAELITRFNRDEDVGDVVIICSCSLRAVEKAKTAHRGKDRVAKFSMDTAIIATGDEGEELLERLTEVRLERERGNQGNLADSIEDEYTGLTHRQAQALCKERGLNGKGSRLELIQRLREND